MKFCSRSTLGVTIGVLNVISFITVIIVAAVYLAEFNTNDKENHLQGNEIARAKIILSLVIVFGLIMLIISGLFIVGVVKRLHKFMIPWLILSGIGFVINCGRITFIFFGAVFSGVPFATCIIVLVVGLLSTAISVLILWPIYTLFGDIRQNNINGPSRRLMFDEIGYKSEENY